MQWARREDTDKGEGLLLRAQGSGSGSGSSSRLRAQGPVLKQTTHSLSLSTFPQVWASTKDRVARPKRPSASKFQIVV
jgi:hypothetical protein